MAEFGSLIPFRWRTPEWQPAIVQFVVVNWLDVELEWQGPQTQAEYEALGALRGWRNREVRAFIEASDWTAKLFASNALQKRNEELDYPRSRNIRCRSMRLVRWRRWSKLQEWLRPAWRAEPWALNISFRTGLAYRVVPARIESTEVKTNQ